MRRAAHALTLAAVLAAAALAGCTSAPSDSADATPGGVSPAATVANANGATPGGGAGGEGATPATNAPATPSEGIVPPPDQPPTATDGRASSAPTAPLVVALHAEDARAFFGAGTRVALTLTGSGHDDVRAGIALPEGVELVEGNLSYRGGFDGGPLTLAATLRASEAGAYALRGWAEAAVPVGSRVAPSAVLLVDGSTSEATFSVGAPSRPDIRVTMTPQGTTAVDVTASSGVATGARLVLDAPDAFPSAGSLDETLQLSGGVPVARRVELGAAERWEGTGHQTLVAYLYPDPSVDGRLHAALLHYWWEGDTLRVSTTPPDAEPAGSGAGAATGGGGGTTPQPASPS